MKPASVTETWQSSEGCMQVVGEVRGIEIHSKVGTDVDIPTKRDFQAFQMTICQAIVGSLSYLVCIILLMALKPSPMMAGQVGVRYYPGQKMQHHLHCRN